MLKSDELFDLAILNSIKKKLLQRKETIAVAESVTSGLIQTAFSSAPDASQFYHGGITAYNLAQKYKHLKIEPIQAMKCNCVSIDVAEYMGLNVCDLFASEWGLGVTGYAVAVPESGNKLYAYGAIAYKRKVLSAWKMEPDTIAALSVQLFYVTQLLEELEHQLELVR